MKLYFKVQSKLRTQSQLGLHAISLYPNAMSLAYDIVKTPHDKLSICCITFAYVYNKLFIFINLHNNWIVLLDNFLSLAYVNCTLYNVN